MTEQNVYNVPVVGPGGTTSYYSGPTSGFEAYQRSLYPQQSSDPTIANSPVRRYSPGNSRYQSEADSYYSTLNRSMPNESNIREDMRRRVQEQLDAINNTYAGLVRSEQTRGEGRLGSTRAVNARSGTIGQDFGNAHMDKTTELNTANVKALEDERAYKIASILEKADMRAEEKIQNEKNQALKNSQDYLTYLKDSEQSAKDEVANLSKLGASFDQLAPDQVTKFLEQTGYTQDQLKNLFILNKPADKTLYSGVQGNKYIVVSEDPITKKRKTDSIDLGFTVPADYDVQKMGDNTLVFFPKNYDPAKGKSQILTYTVGGTTPAAKVIKSGSYEVKQSELTEATQALEQTRGSDGYANPDSYQRLYQNWINSGGTPEDFVKYFPPTYYINPANVDLPQYLRPKSTSSSNSNSSTGA